MSHITTHAKYTFITGNNLKDLRRRNDLHFNSLSTAAFTSIFGKSRFPSNNDIMAGRHVFTSVNVE